MRVWFAALLAVVMLIGSGAISVAAPHKGKASKSSGVAYVCVNCGVGAAHSVPCPICKAPMGRLATYACMKCQISSYTPSPCPNCHEPMPSVASQYRHCGACGNYYLKSKKACPVCAKRRKLARR